jgi:integrase
VAGIRGTSAAIKSKHLRQLGACLATSSRYGYLDVNPVAAYKKHKKPKVPRGTPPFTDGEVARLLAAMAGEEGVYVAVVRAALTTGCRVGELVALTWDSLSLTEKRLEVRHTWNDVDGLTAPKDRDHRTVYLTPQALEVLEEWATRQGAGATATSNS